MMRGVSRGALPCGRTFGAPSASASSAVRTCGAGVTSQTIAWSARSAISKVSAAIAAMGWFA